ncbi:glycolate oxidase subunit GlcE [Roseovarius pelagicus]|uniref:Glycolate oxidase subunit GlcE n=1 Tax=Roseovarius pelagicus TaxID=2980108 RepID=A0ABY6DG30_9RHOB|nr:glycolate oxidase subunit GlcE [Roseovarius pelagicus]UXX85136.1 glycolate oxidase subunit GlcE [Roseovarius pelagicus]
MRPETETALAEIIKAATGPLRIEGGGTRSVERARTGETLSMSAMRGIDLYEPGALTMVAKAGTPLEEVEAALAKEGQRLPFEPMDHRPLLGTDGIPTIGGVFAANISGPRRIQVGAARDFLLGVRFVDGAGRVVSNGGRVMKNVTGYDLVKLMAGSRGTLGVLTELSFKVLPKSDFCGVLSLEGLDDVRAVAALCRALGSPYEVSGAAHMQKGSDGVPVTMIRLEGFEKSVRYRANALQKLLGEFGVFQLETDPECVDACWCSIRDVVPFKGHAGDVWRVSVKPTDAPTVVAQVSGADAIYDWGGGLIWLRVNGDSHASAIRDAVAAVGGHATRVRGTGPDAFHPLPSSLAALEAGLRARFDPSGILNPGLMGSVA